MSTDGAGRGSRSVWYAVLLLAGAGAVGAAVWLRASSAGTGHAAEPRAAVAHVPVGDAGASGGAPAHAAAPPAGRTGVDGPAAGSELARARREAIDAEQDADTVVINLDDLEVVEEEEDPRPPLAPEAEAHVLTFKGKGRDRGMFFDSLCVVAEAGMEPEKGHARRALAELLDLDSDDIVGPADLVELIEQKGLTGKVRADFDGSGVVDDADLRLFERGLTLAGGPAERTP
ncbi:MAG: hypothetical protein SFZ24_01030 [Planctomycetota bacterium]|nr:hypothetical protein [Planctomycetota bacterium]